MKRKINTIKGKRLVMGGGTNSLTKDEILVTETSNGIELKERSSDGSIKELAGGSSEGGNIVSIFKNPVCYKIDMSYHNSNVPGSSIVMSTSLACMKTEDKIYKVPLSIVVSGKQNAYFYSISENVLSDFAMSMMGPYSTIREYVEEYEQGEIVEISTEEFLKVWNEAE